jgi:hypothetical protein
MAANCSRNLLLGWKPEQHTDLKKMRNNVWNEASSVSLSTDWGMRLIHELSHQKTKRLYERKSKGKLVIDSKDY